jgi:hypothetical protein
MPYLDLFLRWSPPQPPRYLHHAGLWPRTDFIPRCFYDNALVSGFVAPVVGLCDVPRKIPVGPEISISLKYQYPKRHPNLQPWGFFACRFYQTANADR